MTWGEFAAQHPLAVVRIKEIVGAEWPEEEADLQKGAVVTPLATGELVLWDKERDFKCVWDPAKGEWMPVFRAEAVRLAPGTILPRTGEMVEVDPSLPNAGLPIGPLKN